jgi:hypothetical protein
VVWFVGLQHVVGLRERRLTDTLRGRGLSPAMEGRGPPTARGRWLADTLPGVRALLTGRAEETFLPAGGSAKTRRAPSRRRRRAGAAGPAGNTSSASREPGPVRVSCRVRAPVRPVVTARSTSEARMTTVSTSASGREVHWMERTLEPRLRSACSWRARARCRRSW